MTTKPLLLGIIILVCFFAMLRASGQTLDSSQVYQTGGHKYTVEVLAQQKDIVWGFDFLSEDRIIFTERKGALRIYNPKTKAVADIKASPKVWAQGQGGLLDVRVHPTQKSKIYLTYSESVDGKATTAFAMAELEANSLTNFKKILSAHAPSPNDQHFGSRIEFDHKGHVFVSIGERKERDWVQDLSYHAGKVLRFNEDGSVPEDNPFVKRKAARPEIWAYGIRNSQGLSRHPTTGELWLAEMGPKGGDELNLIKKGGNYGWPIVTYGREYWGPKIGEGVKKAGIIDPVVYWVPSISPTGFTIYEGDRFKNWTGQFFLGTLSGKHIRRLVMNGTKLVSQDKMLDHLGLRFRNVRAGPDGLLYFSTDDGKIARIVPAK